MWHEDVKKEKERRERERERVIPQPHVLKKFTVHQGKQNINRETQ